MEGAQRERQVQEQGWWTEEALSKWRKMEGQSLASGARVHGSVTRWTETRRKPQNLSKRFDERRKDCWTIPETEAGINREMQCVPNGSKRCATNAALAGGSAVATRQAT